MFGYVTPRRLELRLREDIYYRSVYCGLCRAMKKTTGWGTNLSLSYDFVFYQLISMQAEGEMPELHRRRCIVHPFRRRKMLALSESLRRTARISLAFTYHKLRDDLADRGHRLRAILAYPLFRRAYRRMARRRPLSCESELRRSLDTLAAIERERVPSVDRAADAFGQMLGAAFREGREGDLSRILYEIGYRLGRFIYAADAAEDYDDDMRRGNYNPYLLAYGGRPLTDSDRAAMHTALTLELSRLAAAIDLLPEEGVCEGRELIRNILYLGLPDRIAFLKKNEGVSPSSCSKCRES